MLTEQTEAKRTPEEKEDVMYIGVRKMTATSTTSSQDKDLERKRRRRMKRHLDQAKKQRLEKERDIQTTTRLAQELPNCNWLELKIREYQNERKPGRSSAEAEAETEDQRREGDQEDDNEEEEEEEEEEEGDSNEDSDEEFLVVDVPDEAGTNNTDSSVKNNNNNNNKNNNSTNRDSSRGGEAEGRPAAEKDPKAEARSAEKPFVSPHEAHRRQHLGGRPPLAPFQSKSARPEPPPPLSQPRLSTGASAPYSSSLAQSQHKLASPATATSNRLSAAAALAAVPPAQRWLGVRPRFQTVPSRQTEAVLGQAGHVSLFSRRKLSGRSPGMDGQLLRAEKPVAATALAAANPLLRVSTSSRQSPEHRQEINGSKGEEENADTPCLEILENGDTQPIQIRVCIPGASPASSQNVATLGKEQEEEVVAMVNQYDYMLGNLLNKLDQTDNKQSPAPRIEAEEKRPTLAAAAADPGAEVRSEANCEEALVRRRNKLLQDIESLQWRKMKEMEELFHIQSVKERCLNDLEKARMEMAYIESFRHLPVAGSPRLLPPHPSGSPRLLPPGYPVLNAANNGLPPASSSSASSLLQQRPPGAAPQPHELPRLLQADGCAPSGVIAKHLMQGIGKPADQDCAPLLGLDGLNGSTPGRKSDPYPRPGARYEGGQLSGPWPNKNKDLVGRYSKHRYGSPLESGKHSYLDPKGPFLDAPKQSAPYLEPDTRSGLRSMPLLESRRSTAPTLATPATTQTSELREVRRLGFQHVQYSHPTAHLSHPSPGELVPSHGQGLDMRRVSFENARSAEMLAYNYPRHISQGDLMNQLGKKDQQPLRPPLAHYPLPAAAEQHRFNLAALNGGIPHATTPAATAAYAREEATDLALRSTFPSSRPRALYSSPYGNGTGGSGSSPRLSLPLPKAAITPPKQQQLPSPLDKTTASSIARMNSSLEYKLPPPERTPDKAAGQSLDGTKCENCGKDAHFMCSACKGAHYCSTQCQRDRWLDHCRDCRAV